MKFFKKISTLGILVFFLLLFSLKVDALAVNSRTKVFTDIFSFLDFLKYSILNLEFKDSEKEKIFNFLEQLQKEKEKISDSFKEKFKNFKILEIGWVNNKGEIYVKNDIFPGYVFSSDFTLVGKVFDFNTSSRKIKSLLEPNFEFNIAKEGEFLGLARTLGFGLLEINLSKEKTLAEGEIIFTGGKDNVFEPGFVIGKVVKKIESAVEEKLIIKIFFEPTKTHYLVLVPE